MISLWGPIARMIEAASLEGGLPGRTRVLRACWGRNNNTGGQNSASVEGEAAVFTGCNSGIGLAPPSALLRRGHLILLLDADKPR
jgi:hypothetical protein